MKTSIMTCDIIERPKQHGRVADLYNCVQCKSFVYLGQPYTNPNQLTCPYCRYDQTDPLSQEGD